MTKTPMSAILATALFASLASYAHAGNTFSCPNVNGVEENTIYVDLNKKLAGFFDNDKTTVIPYVGTDFFETHPVQTQFRFEGSDTGGAAGTKMRISFTEMGGRYSASVTFKSGRRDEFTWEANDGCHFDSKVNLELKKR